MSLSSLDMAQSIITSSIKGDIKKVRIKFIIENIMIFKEDDCKS